MSGKKTSSGKSSSTRIDVITFEKIDKQGVGSATELDKSLPGESSGHLADVTSPSAINFYHSPFIVVKKDQSLKPADLEERNFLGTIGQPCHVLFKDGNKDIYTNPPTSFVESSLSSTGAIANTIKLRFVILAGTSTAPACIIWSPSKDGQRSTYRHGDRTVTLERVIPGAFQPTVPIQEDYTGGIRYPFASQRPASAINSEWLTEIGLDFQVLQLTEDVEVIGGLTFVRVTSRIDRHIKQPLFYWV